MSFDTNAKNQTVLPHPDTEQDSPTYAPSAIDPASYDDDDPDKPKRKNRKLKGTDTPTEEEERIKRKLEELFEEMADSPLIIITNILQCMALLRLILLFLKYVIAENLFRYLLGLISVHTNLTNAQIAECAGCSSKRVSRGRQEVFSHMNLDFRRARKKGAGRKRLSASNPEIAREIMRYVELRAYGPCTGGTQSYTAATLDGISKHIYRKFQCNVSKTSIRNLLIENGYKPHTNKKYLYGNEATETEAQRIIRHAQFEYIHEVLEKANNPECILLSIDCKKKENLGNFQQKGKSWSRFGTKCYDHDFPIPLKLKTLDGMDDLLHRQEGKAIPFGVYDISMNKGYVSVGITHDTAEFVAESIYRFFAEIKADHPHANTLYLLCDGGGSNSAIHYDFKYQMGRLSKRIGMKIVVVHYPPYRSKFNKIERKLFAPISKNFERQPLLNLALVLELIRNTKTTKGLTVKTELDVNFYKLGQKPTTEQMNALSIEYTGPTKKERTKLSYIIDGRKLSNELYPLEVEYQTVFELAQEEKDKPNSRRTGKGTETDEGKSTDI